MPALTNAQVLSVWLVATSNRSSLPPGDPNAIMLTDDANLTNAAGVDVTQPDVAKARDFLINPDNAADVSAANDLFVSMIESLGYEPPHCPPDSHLKGLSKLPSA